MPNWAFGYVNVTGTRDGIKSFIERFVSEDDPSTIPGKRFFARSFIQSKRQAFIDEAMKEFSEPAVDAKASYSFVASFAWSAFIACLFSNNENDFVWQKIERDLEEEENTIMELSAFWNNHVMARVEPPLVEKPDAVLESLRRYFGPADKSEPTVDLDRKFVVNLKEILALKEEKRSLDAQVKALETRIKSLYAPIVEEMGTACKGTCEQGGECFKVSYNPLYREGISKDRLSALRAQYPDIYDEFVDRTESRIFKVVKSAIA